MADAQQLRWGSKEFGAFLDWLDPDPERAGQAYIRLRNRLQYFFEGWRDSAPRAAELADKAIDRAVKKINEDSSVRSREPAIYLLSIARYILMEDRKVPRSVPLAMDPPQSDQDDNEELERRLECLRGCLLRLPTEEHDLVKKYYLYDDQGKIRARREAAEQVNTSRVALRVRMFRIRRLLEKCIEDCLKRNCM